MKKKSIFSMTLLTLCLLTLLVCSQETSAPQEGLYKYLPQSGEAGEWKKSDTPLEYKGEDLYEYIDGGAEIYHEYGFEEVIAQDYKNHNEKTISLEIFKMTSDIAAYGIFTFKRSDRGESVEIGNGGQLEDYYMNFWKGHFLVTLTGYDEDKGTIEGLIEIAKAVDEKIESEGKEPPLVSLVPDEELVKQSITYLKGNIGLYNCYMFFPKNIFKFQDGVKGNFEGGYQVYIFRYSDKEESQKRFDEVSEIFKESEKYKDFQIIESAFEVKDDKNTLILVQPFQEYILIVLGAGSRDAAVEALVRTQDRISQKK